MRDRRRGESAEFIVIRAKFVSWPSVAEKILVLCTGTSLLVVDLALCCTNLVKDSSEVDVARLPMNSTVLFGRGLLVVTSCHVSSSSAKLGNLGGGVALLCCWELL